jgi:hypothetical protein
MKINGNLIGKKVRVTYSYFNDNPVNPIVITGILKYVNENGDIHVLDETNHGNYSIINSWIISIEEIK